MNFQNSAMSATRGQGHPSFLFGNRLLERLSPLPLEYRVLTGRQYHKLLLSKDVAFVNETRERIGTAVPVYGWPPGRILFYSVDQPPYQPGFQTYRKVGTDPLPGIVLSILRPFSLTYRQVCARNNLVFHFRPPSMAAGCKYGKHSLRATDVQLRYHFSFWDHKVIGKNTHGRTVLKGTG